MNSNTHVMLSLLLVFSVLFHGVFSAPDPPPLLLRCGSDEDGTDDYGRKWTSDSKFLDAKSSSLAAPVGFQDPSMTSQVPYMEARVFTAVTAYKFPIKRGNRYWLRLHFYPSTYGPHDSSKSLFSVTANDLSLLKNFSAYITCEAFTQAYLIREFSVAALETDSLILTFTPVSGSGSGFAFVNGIELIEMPEMFGDAVMVGGAGNQAMDIKGMSMQTMVRLNVGGGYISPTNDSGLSRAWFDDFGYIYGASEGVEVVASKRLVIDYKDMATYIAPVEVYKTLRSMGTNKNVNSGFNLTWVFPNIDPGFMYLMRLHFCDLTSSRANQMVFHVAINNQTTGGMGIDVFSWAGSKGVPKFRDYVVFSPAAPSMQQIWLALSPDMSDKPEFEDAMLNGIELFKLESGKNLGGKNPQTSEFRMKVDEAETERKFETKGHRAEVIGGAAGGAAAFVVVALCCAAYQRKNRMPGTDSHTTSWLPIYGNSHSSGSKSTISGKSTATTLAQGLARHFSLPEILNATKNFSDSNVIGVGGFGKVYKGVVDGGTKVAIKRSNPQSEQGVHEFLTEIDLLSKLRHKHLVSLIGFCDEENEMCLVYDYMGLGTLREHLYKTTNKLLSWKQRLEICIGAARGLHYLHTGAQYTIIHRDVKTTNILLDENWVAKVSDFGLSKTGPNMSTGHVSTVVKGSFGYLDPEYFRRQQLTEKSDVYSFGVVLFEVLCARPALNPSLPKEQVSLADWALHCKRKGVLDDLIDPHLKGKITPESLKKFADAAEKCLDDHGAERPSMGDVLWNLEFALQLQESADGGGSSHRSRMNDEDNRRKQDMAAHYNNLSLGSEEDLFENNEQNDSAIFSQLVHPKGR